MQKVIPPPELERLAKAKAKFLKAQAARAQRNKEEAARKRNLKERKRIASLMAAEDHQEYLARLPELHHRAEMVAEQMPKVMSVTTAPPEI